MGIHSLLPFIRKACPKAVNNSLTIKDFAGKRIAVDASIWMYQVARDNDNSYIPAFWNRVQRLIDAKTTPIIVFDGKPPRMKLKTQAKRRLQKEKQAKAATAKATARPVVVITESMFETVRELLDFKRVKWYIAPSEAEAYCAELVYNSQADIVLTDDSDILCFGAGTVIRKFSNSICVETISLETLLTELGITQGQFVDMCILTGSDYLVGGAPGVGPVKALALIRQHMDIETLISKKLIKIKCDDLDSDFWDYKSARHLFFNWSKDAEGDVAPIISGPGTPCSETLFDFCKKYSVNLPGKEQCTFTKTVWKR